jgi:alpha/beta superfamily hydrolase
VCWEPGEKEQNRKKYSNSRVERGRVTIRHPHPITEGRKEGKRNEKRKNTLKMG